MVFLLHTVPTFSCLGTTLLLQLATSVSRGLISTTLSIDKAFILARERCGYLLCSYTLIVVSEATPKDSPEMYKQRNFIRDDRLYFPVMTYI